MINQQNQRKEKKRTKTPQEGLKVTKNEKAGVTWTKIHARRQNVAIP